jgi:hypothetical protein
MFPLPALADLAGRRQLGGDREVALAALVCAHLVVGVLPDRALPVEACTRRVAGARAWLATIALPAAARTACARVIDATGHGDVPALRQMLRNLLDAVGASLDAPSRRELERLLAALVVKPSA